MDEAISSIFSIKKEKPMAKKPHGSWYLFFIYIQYRYIKKGCHITLHDIDTYIYMPAEDDMFDKSLPNQMTNGFKLFSLLLSFLFNLLTCVWVGFLGVLWVRFCSLYNISTSTWTFKKGLYRCKKIFYYVDLSIYINFYLYVHILIVS